MQTARVATKRETKKTPCEPMKRDTDSENSTAQTQRVEQPSASTHLFRLSTNVDNRLACCSHTSSMIFLAEETARVAIANSAVTTTNTHSTTTVAEDVSGYDSRQHRRQEHFPPHLLHEHAR